MHVHMGAKWCDGDLTAMTRRPNYRKKIAHSHMIRQEGTHGPDDGNCEAEGNSTSCAFAKSMTKVFDVRFPR